MVLAPLNTFRFLLRHPLTADRPVEALARYVRWQVGSRLSPGPVAVDYVNESRLLVRRGMTGATGNIYAGLHEFEDMAFVLHALRPADLFADIGANVGSYTVLAAKGVGSRVIAFEPIPTTFANLRDNVALNDVRDLVEPVMACVGNRTGSVSMSTKLDTVNRVLEASDTPERGRLEVPIVRLDDRLSGRVPFLMKLDVEGYESEVLRGAVSTLSDLRLCAVVAENAPSVHRHGGRANDVDTLLQECGFRLYRYLPFERRLAACLPSDKRGTNTIYVRNAELVRDRLGSAPRFRVVGREI